MPALATSWKNLDDLTWETARDDVKFSNGPFTSEDVLFICRTLNNETNVSQSCMDTTKLITDVQTPDAHTVIIKTGAPFPLMPAEMARSLPIIWNGIVEHGKLTFDPKKGCGAMASNGLKSLRQGHRHRAGPPRTTGVPSPTGRK